MIEEISFSTASTSLVLFFHHIGRLFIMSLQIGKEAPGFKVSAFADGEFKEIGLEEYKGKWVVLFFYPADFTFVCPTELVGVANKYEDLKKLDAEVLAISTDSHFVHMMWQEHELSKMVEGGLPFPMLYDAGGRIGKDYNVYDKNPAWISGERS